MYKMTNDQALTALLLLACPQWRCGDVELVGRDVEESTCHVIMLTTSFFREF